MTPATLLWLIFSTLGGLEVAKADPKAAAVLLDEGLIQVVPVAHAVYYQVAPAGYVRWVRL